MRPYLLSAYFDSPLSPESSGCQRYSACMSFRYSALSPNGVAQGFSARYPARCWISKPIAGQSLEYLRQEAPYPLVARVIEELSRRQVFDDLTLVEHDDAVGHFAGKAQLVRDCHDGHLL